MTDRELLEAAANATGKKWKWTSCPRYDEQEVPGIHLRDEINGVDYYFGWNPLETSEDAFTLMTLLRISVEQVSRTHVYAYKDGDTDRVHCIAKSESQEDVDTAVRLAIVKCAGGLT